MMLHLVCDISGSMSEGGKPFNLRTLATTVAQWLRHGYGQAEIRLCAWSSEARSIPNWSVTDDLPVEMLVCHGSTNGEALVQLLGSEPDGKVLILTDGFWTRDGVKTLSRWQEGLPPDTLRVIQIGADANPHLSKGLKGAKVFAAEEVLAVLDNWLQADEEWA
ncbi:VWA domain-containing protein [Stenotrophomonas maltophilia]|nr:VWA domain-containing protein [Stenotrophomonas pavanii]MBH1540989.1 VWA domain-containing protein [Stenotrophomonas maltophilia]